MEQLRTSTYRRMQSSVAKWMNAIKMRHMGFDTRICGRTYSVVGIDYKNNTYAVMIYETAGQVKKHKAEWLAARGKFSRVLVMVPSREVAYKVNDMLPYDMGLLVENSQWRGAQSWRHGYSVSASKHITTAKIQEAIGFRNTDLIKTLVEWIGSNPGKKLDDTLIEVLQERSRRSFEEMMQAREKADGTSERYRGLYSFLIYFMDTDNIDKIAAVGYRMSYSPFSDYKEPRNRDNEIGRNGFCAEALKAIMKTSLEAFHKLDALCKKCKVSKKGGYYPTKWNELSTLCSKCPHIAGQDKMVKAVHKYDKYLARHKARADRKLA